MVLLGNIDGQHNQISSKKLELNCYLRHNNVEILLCVKDVQSAIATMLVTAAMSIDAIGNTCRALQLGIWAPRRG